MEALGRLGDHDDDRAKVVLIIIATNNIGQQTVHHVTFSCRLHF